MGPDAVGTREELGRALTQKREQSGHSVRGVAEHVDALLGTVAGWFAGQHAPTAASREMYLRVLAACGITDHDELDEWWAAAVRASKRARKRARPDCPYRGFESFSSADGALFFSRDQIVEKLVQVVAQRSREPLESTVNVDNIEPLLRPWVHGVLVVGASGVGKSSLVRAGLLAQVGAPGPLESWRAAVMVPGDDSVPAFQAACETLDGTSASGPMLLVVDQMEEFWTQNSAEVRREFSRALAEFVSSRHVVVVGVLRADFYDRIAASPALAPVVADAQVLVPPMTLDQLREVIVRPAAVAGAEVDDDLVGMLIDDLTPASASGRGADKTARCHCSRTPCGPPGSSPTVVDSGYTTTCRQAGSPERSNRPRSRCMRRWTPRKSRSLGGCCWRWSMLTKKRLLAAPSGSKISASIPPNRAPSLWCWIPSPMRDW